MGFPVYDYRTDLRNVLVTPQIRSRFLRVEPGPMPDPHTHDLGHEIFLVLSGRAEFEIDGEKAEVGPGQMCVALVDQPHAVRALGDEPVTMYLSVTPHIQPTHTTWTPDDAHAVAVRAVRQLRRRLRGARPPGTLTSELAGAAKSLADAAKAASADQEETLERLRQAIEDGDLATAAELRNRAWGTLFPVFQQANAVADLWNELAPRADGDV